MRLALFLALPVVLSACTPYVARLNADCRELRDFVVVDTNNCVICAKTGKTVLACELKGNP